MNRIAKTAVVALVAVFIASPAAMAGNGKKRQVNQSARIRQGVQSGELTKGETRSLVRQQKRIQTVRQNAVSDGTVTVKERVHIDNMQDRASGNIYRYKHNGLDR
jgi:hypothetical protein